MSSTHHASLTRNIDLPKEDENEVSKEDARVALLSSRVLDVPIGVLTLLDAVKLALKWSQTSDHARLITFANVHMVVEASVRPAFRQILEEMDLNCPDGSPLFWILRRRFGKRVSQVSGPDFMPLFCERALETKCRHFFYGGAEGVAQEAANVLKIKHPGLQVAGHFSPPYGTLSPEEVETVVSTINNSGADVVWVCLGCPKQEIWMNEFRDRLNVKVIFAVGQAFDILAGRHRRAPAFVRKIGMEWAFRLMKEPKRLWKRYLVTNFLFVALLAKSKVSER